MMFSVFSNLGDLISFQAKQNVSRSPVTSPPGICETTLELPKKLHIKKIEPETDWESSI